WRNGLGGISDVGTGYDTAFESRNACPEDRSEVPEEPERRGPPELLHLEARPPVLRVPEPPGKRAEDEAGQERQQIAPLTDRRPSKKKPDESCCRNGRRQRRDPPTHAGSEAERAPETEPSSGSLAPLVKFQRNSQNHQRDERNARVGSIGAQSPVEQ